jgi:hypothetical protein
MYLPVLCLANLYAGQFVQLTIRRMGCPCLCNFIVPYMWCAGIHVYVFRFIIGFYDVLTIVYAIPCDLL